MNPTCWCGLPKDTPHIHRREGPSGKGELRGYVTATPPDSDAQSRRANIAEGGLSVARDRYEEAEELAAEAVLQLGKVHAQVAVLRDALTDVLEYMARDYPSDSIDFSDAWRVLADTEATAKAYRDEIEWPWREALTDLVDAYLDIRHDFGDGSDAIGKARALLSNTESEAGK